MGLYNDVDLHAFVDNQVSPDRREAIAAYLKTSPADSARVELWRRQNEAIKAVFSGSGSDPVPLWLTVGQIASSHDKTIPLPKRATRKPFRSDSGPVRLRLPGAAKTSPLLVAALAFAAGLSVPYATAHIPGLDAIAQFSTADDRARLRFERRALEAHETFGTDHDNPVDVIDQPPGHLRAWFERRVAFPVRVPDLVDQGWTLLGGRIAPGEIGPGVLMVYQRDGNDRLSLYISRVPQNIAHADTAVVDPPGVMAWSEGAVGYGLVSTLPDPWLKHNATALRSALHEPNPD